LRKRLLVIAAVVLVAAAAAGWLALDNPRVLRAAWPYLPQSVQTRPVFYTQHALSIIENAAFASPAVNWESTRAAALARARQGSSIEDAHAAVRVALAALGDQRSVLTFPDPASAGRGAYGFQVLHPERVVAVVFPGSVAAAAGIKPGDVVESVDGGVPAPSADPRARGHLIQIPSPSVSLRIAPPGPAGPETAAREVRLTAGGFQPIAADVRRLDGGAAYVELPGTAWTPDFAARLRETMTPGANAPCGWIVDLRRNPGGDLGALLQALRPLLGAEPFGAYVSATGATTPWAFGGAAGQTDTAPPAAVALLVSRLTAGGGETAVVAFRGRQTGTTTVIGEPTWGLGTGTSDFALADGATLQLLTRREADRTGRLQEGPVVPEIAASTSWARFATADDPAFAAATGWVAAACRTGLSEGRASAPPSTPTAASGRGRGRAGSPSRSRRSARLAAAREWPPAASRRTAAR
jgi:C-terminal processing protease CtpA/Prc